MINNENQCPNCSYITEDGIKVGSWTNNQRSNKKKNKLDEEKIKLLEKLDGWFWKLNLDKLWLDNYELLKEYMINNDKQCPNCSYITDDGINLGIWISRQRSNKKKKKLDEEKIKLLEQIPGWWWDSNIKYIKNM